MPAEYKPRLCHITRGSNGYGFHLHGEKGKYGQCIRKVEDDSPADHSGLKAGDRIVAVNGKNVESESHQQVEKIKPDKKKPLGQTKLLKSCYGVVARIKERSGETELLVVDQDADKYFRDNNIPITEDLIRSDQPEPVAAEETPEDPSAAMEESNDTAKSPSFDEEVSPSLSQNAMNNDGLRPRLCHLVRGANGYGFNLHSEKGKAGRYIRSVDDNSPAVEAGVKGGDRIIEVNGKNMEYDKHAELVNAIKQSGQEVDLLVVDDDTDAFFKSCKVTPTSAHVSGPLPTPVKDSPAPASPVDNEPPASAKENAPQSNGTVLLSMDLTALKERSRSRKKQAPTSNWNNRQAIFNNL